MPVKKPETPLLPRQIFGIKRQSLEKKMTAFFAATKDTSSVVEYAVAIMVRNALCNGDFSFFLRELLCEIFLTAEPSDVLRHFCVYFKSYFSGGDWAQVIDRLFKNKKEYHRMTQQAQVYNQRLKTPGTGECKNPDLHLRLLTVFEDANGKRHSLTIRDSDESRTKTETDGLLEILTTLTVFENEGVRRFTKLLKSNRPGAKETFGEEEESAAVSKGDEVSVSVPTANEALTQEIVTAEAAEEAEKETLKIMVPHGFDPRSLSDEEAVLLVKAHLPENKTLADIQVLFVERPAEAANEASVKETPVMVSEGSAPATNEDVSPAVTVADPPPKKKRNRPLSAKEAYIQGLINDRKAKKAMAKKQ